MPPFLLILLEGTSKGSGASAELPTRLPPGTQSWSSGPSRSGCCCSVLQACWSFCFNSKHTRRRFTSPQLLSSNLDEANQWASETLVGDDDMNTFKIKKGGVKRE